MSDRKSRVLKGFFASLGGGVLLQIVSLLVIPLYLDFTSQELFGIWLTLGAVLSWIQISDMGLGLSLTKRSVEALEESDYELLRRLIFGSIFSTLFFGAMVAAVGFLITDFLINFFGIREIYQQSFIQTYHLLLLIAVLGPSLATFSSIINAKQHIAFLNIKNTSLKLISIAVTIFLLFNDFGIVSFAYGLLSEFFLMIIIDLVYLKKIDRKISLYPFKTSVKEVLSLIKFGSSYQALKIANVISTNTDNIIIASILGASSVTIFVFTGKLAFLLAVFLISVLPSVLFPGIAQLFELSDNMKIEKVYSKLTEFSLRLGLFSGITYLYVNEAFISIWVGLENYGGDLVTIAFVLWIFIESFIRGLTSIILASGSLSGYTVVSLMEAMLNITFTLLLIDHFGLIGVVLGTVISRIITLFYVPWKINSLLSIKSSSYIKNILKNIIIYSIPMLLVGYGINSMAIFSEEPILYILTIIASLLFTNVFLYEGIFLISQKGLSLKNRIKSLKDEYYSV